ncbi:hypothetical protein AAZX31_18G225900 [Glycine max]|uniref:Uncharacterized protein n=1 Tax=Glycine soja TaxID=3848 RepID=A0A445FWF7_GLYSO|nr:uncharacterized protein LOC114396792 isoform X1 [Glycine soja]KAG4922548.1 hypothetical protein JHK86_051361 [Glycine max]KAG4937308.1 hypothetical protein JHK85_052227 [Glycine max]KAH1199898.1 hypothetical protein GmHk_18G053145 [Glycine max]KHN40502.1 hypothetical protein glysoja_001000 [Glycine soja]RZB53268.1 hypothetical protein D0Y65_049327 [Glycine soja]
MADQKLLGPAFSFKHDELTSRFLEKLRLLEELRLLQDRLFKEPENNDECRKNGSLKRLNDQSDVCGFRSCFKNDYDLLQNQRCLRNREEVIQETMEMELENMMELGTLEGKKTYSFKNGTRSALNLENTTRSFLDNNKSNDNNWNGEMTLPLLVDKSTVCMLNKDEEVDEPLSPGKHMKTAQSVLSFLIATIALLWILTDLCSLLSIIKLQPEHGPLPIWFSLLEPVGFMVFVWAVAAKIVIGAPFSRLLSAILLFWGIWLLVRSSQSLTTLCLPILGILLMVWHLCSRKSSCQIKGNEQGSEAPKIKPMCFTFAV